MFDVTVRDLENPGMIALRGDHGAIAGICREVTGAAFPAMGRIETAGDCAIAWMSPDEVLLLVTADAVRDGLDRISKGLAGIHHLAVDVSDARAMFQVAGPGAREVLAKLAPVDLHPASFGPGQFRRSRLGQVAAAFWMLPSGAFQVVCFRSVADYARALLTQSAKDGGVGHFR